MKRLLIFTLLSTILISVHAQLRATSFETAKRQGSGNIVLVYNEVSGFTERSGENAKGFLVDLMIEFEKYVKEQKGINLTHSFTYADNDFPAFLKHVKEGEGGIFGLGNVSIKEDRKDVYEFSPPFLENISLLVTNSNVPVLTDMNSLSAKFNGMKALSIKSTTNDERIQEIKEQYLSPSTSVEYFNSTAEVLQALVKDENAFAVIDLNFYLEALNARMPIRRHAVGDERDDPFGIIMPKNCDWSPVMDEFFNSGFIESGRYSEIIAKNLGNSALRLINRIKNQ